MMMMMVMVMVMVMVMMIATTKAQLLKKDIIVK